MNLFLESGCVIVCICLTSLCEKLLTKNFKVAIIKLAKMELATPERTRVGEKTMNKAGFPVK